MTKKDYIKIARVIKDNTITSTLEHIDKKSLLYDLSVVFKADNKNFDKYKFVTACNPNQS